MTVLKSGRELTDAILAALDGSRCLCAVAFWGTEGDTILGATGKSDLRVVCNLSMGGTNPRVIEQLCAQGVMVRQNPLLHSKVYIGERKAVVTSANASINGLNLGPVEKPGWIEAGVVVPASMALGWFEQLWSTSNQVLVPKDIDDAMQLYSRLLGVQSGNVIATPASGVRILQSETDSRKDTRENEMAVERSTLYSGVSVRKGIAFVLEKFATPLSPKTVADELEAGGLVTAAGVRSSVHDALAEGERTGIFVRTGHALWALSSWHLQDRVTKARKAPLQRRELTDEEKARQRQRSIEGLAAARSRGVVGGQPRRILQAQRDAIVKRFREGERAVALAEEYSVSPNAVYKIIREVDARHRSQ